MQRPHVGEFDSDQLMRREARQVQYRLRLVAAVVLPMLILAACCGPLTYYWFTD